MSYVVEGAKTTILKAKDVSTNLVNSSKPWKEFVDKSAFSKPDSFTNAVGRVRKNVAYFGVNYLLLMLIVLVLFLIAKPSSIIWILVLSSCWLYVMAVNPGPVTIGGRTFSQMEKLVATSIFSVIAIFYFSSVGSVLMYAAFSGIGLTAIHGSMRTPENLFSDDATPGIELQAPSTFMQAFSGAFSGLMKGGQQSGAPAAVEAV